MARRCATESGLEEWVLLVNGNFVTTIHRVDFESDWWSNQSAYSNPECNMVKAYAPDDWQNMEYSDDWIECVIIGYCERRLTTEEERAVRKYVARYWQIPF